MPKAKSFSRLIAFTKSGLRTSFGKILIPVNVQASHWLFLAIDLIDKSIELFDSQRNMPRHQKIMSNIQQWLRVQQQNIILKRVTRSKLRVATTTWKTKVNDKIPRQSDSCSCGIFMAYTMLLYCLDADLSSFSQENILDIRRYLFCCIIRNKLLFVNKK